MTDISGKLKEAVAQAADSGTPLYLRGSGSKDFLGGNVNAEALDVTGHRGIVNYEPRELVISARCGTPLQELEEALAQAGQMLPFEPPHFGNDATLGGTVACGLSGPRRPYAGSLRDFLLGCRMLNGTGEDLHFGGEVMKNVAGYDIPRLMAGAQGTLGLLLEVSLKVLPKPEKELTLTQERGAADALRVFNIWAGKPLPISAAAYDGAHLHLRLSGTQKGVDATHKTSGEHAKENQFWDDLRELKLPLFNNELPLWRLSLPADAPPLDTQARELIDWGGAQRWVLSDAPGEKIQRLAQQHGGYATLYRNGQDEAHRAAPLPDVIHGLHRRLKAAFDPRGILNPGRLYEGL